MPTLDEGPSLRRHLPAVLAAADEVVVSDGGSRDDTVAVARELGARVVSGPPGRGHQLNRGAAYTGCDALLFLHADTTLPAGGIDAVRRALAGGAAGGAFLVRFAEAKPILRFGARLINGRTKRFLVPLGDQGQFVRRDAFEALGGFEEWPILEDLDFIRRLRRIGRLVIVETPVTTSARRFVTRGVVRTVATNWLIWLLWSLGVSPRRLSKLYRHVR